MCPAPRKARPKPNLDTLLAQVRSPAPPPGLPAPGAPGAPAALAEYRRMRDFGQTPEPSGDEVPAGDSHRCFVVQKHAASRLHYDFRLELDGVMLSWAVPKGPSYDPRDKRMAVRTEDHPIAYNRFEGVIPKGQYGAGRVLLWDRGHWSPENDPHQGLKDGKLVFTLSGHKLNGRWELVRINPREGEKQQPWILFKKADATARPREQFDVVSALPDSVVARPLRAEPIAAPGAAREPTAGKPDRAGASSAGQAGDAAAAPPAYPSRLPGARPAPLPHGIKPQLASAAAELPPGDWRFEIKLDGYRILARIDADGEVRLITRGGHDWTSKMATLAQAIGRLKLRNSWLDGEVVVLGDDGMPSFNALQNAFDHRRSDSIVYFLFDVPFAQGHDLQACPLQARRDWLAQRLADAAEPRLRFSANFEADLGSLLHSARRLQLEGVMAKRADAPYQQRRTATWLKLKTRQRQEFVIGGFTDRGGVASAAEIGSLLLGVYQGRALQSVGSVGTGWDAEVAADLKQRLAVIEIDTPAFAQADAVIAAGRWSRRNAGQERWVKPQLVAEVSFADWTPDGHIRHAVFHGLRADKPAREVVREEVRAVPKAGRSAAGAAVPTAGMAQVPVTHPERIVDASTGLTKLDLVRYYESVAPWLLPHLKARPCSLVRGPEGLAGQLFFQKHADQLRIPELKSLDPELWPGHAAMLEVPTLRALLGAAQMNVIEFHTWNATTRHIDQPDRMVFDLDPGEGLPWPRMIEAATLVHGLLQELGLKAWLKTSGGKGLHIVVPLAPADGWDAVKDFSQAFVQHIARVIPARFSARSGAANRVGKIFIDYLRNNHGATTAAAFSARARPGLGVSMPVDWADLPALKSGSQWTIANAREHLSFQAEDPWAAYWGCKQTLKRARKRLGIEG